MSTTLEWPRGSTVKPDGVTQPGGGLPAAQLIGRGPALHALDRILDELGQGRAGAIEVAGEAGIGKTRLLRELAARAESRGYLVLGGAAAELERDLPFAVFVDALDQYAAGLESQRLAGLDEQVRTELAQVFPSLWALAGERAVAPQHERYRSHRAVRALLEQLATARPLVLILDDLHWADPASVELLGALLRRPPGAPVVMALALRPLRLSERLHAALERARRADLLVRLELAPLSPTESRELLGGSVAAAHATLLYEESGGIPFYLEQLARSFERTGPASPVADRPRADIGVPFAVAAALAEELGLLSRDGRLVFEGAAVAGDPFEPELAAAAAGRPEAVALDALDELLRLDLVRVTDLPLRFRFRHPLIRRAAYESTSAAWRVGAHERCATALADRGAPASARAHHLERSARQGDLGAIATLREAGDAAARLAPESAARWFAGALRLLPSTAPTEDRVELLLARAGTLAAAGQFAESHEAVLEAAAIVPGQASPLSTRVARVCAGVERFLGRYEQAHVRLLKALRVLPEPDSIESVELLVELTLNEFYRSRYQAMPEWAARAVSAATALEDAALKATAAAMPALAEAMTGSTVSARAHRDEAAALVDELSDQELSLRPEAASWLAVAELYLDLYAESDLHASRAHALSRDTGRGDPLFRLYPVLPRIWYVRGRLAEATELLDGAIEAGRLLGSPPALAGNFFNRSVVALAIGELDVALATAQEGVQLTRDLDEGFVTAWAAVRLAGVLLEIGQAERAVELLVDRAGGEELAFIPGGWRPYCLELLTRCWLAVGRLGQAEQAAHLAELSAEEVRLPLAVAWADRSVAATALLTGDPHSAVDRALASADAARAVGAPIEEALSRVLAGQALARTGQTGRAIEELQRAAATFEACGALRYRDSAERELGKLGHRPHRRTRAGRTDGTGIESLTERELQVVRLVVDRRTNPEIAAELFLSQKTVETHLRNIFNKMGVDTRAAVARAVERSQESAAAGRR